MKIDQKEMDKLMEAFLAKAQAAGISRDVAFGIVGAVQLQESYDLAEVFRTLAFEALKRGVSAGTITTVIAEATNERENALYGPGQVESAYTDWYIPLLYGPPEAMEKRNEELSEEEKIRKAMNNVIFLYGPPEARKK